jgi:hypothetical protein
MSRSCFHPPCPRFVNLADWFQRPLLCSISHSRTASFGLSPTASRTDASGTHEFITEHDENEPHDENRYDNDRLRVHHNDDHNTQTHTNDGDDYKQDENDNDPNTMDDDSDSDDSEGAMSLVFGSSTKPIRPTSMDGAVGTTSRRPRREGRFSMGPAPREDDDDTIGMAASVPSVAKAMTAKPAGSPTTRTIKKAGSGMNGATAETRGVPSGSMRGTSTRPTSRISVRPRVGSVTPGNNTGTTGRTRPTDISMKMNTDRQQAKFAGRLRFPQGHASEDAETNINDKTSETAGNRADQTVGRAERMEKGRALVLPKAPGGRI